MKRSSSHHCTTIVPFIPKLQRGMHEIGAGVVVDELAASAVAMTSAAHAKPSLFMGTSKVGGGR